MVYIECTELMMIQETTSYIETFHKVIEESNKTDRKHTILIVDDEPDNLSLLRRTFRSKYDVLIWIEI